MKTQKPKKVTHNKTNIIYCYCRECEKEYREDETKRQYENPKT